MTHLKGTLHEYQYALLIISRSFLLRVRNILDTRRRENQNTHFISNNVFSKIVQFMR